MVWRFRGQRLPHTILRIGSLSDLKFFPYAFVRASTHPLQWLESLACVKSGVACERLFLEEEALLETRRVLADQLHEKVGMLTSDIDKAIRNEALDLKRALLKWRPGSPSSVPPRLAPSAGLASRFELGTFEKWNKQSGDFLGSWQTVERQFEKEFEQSRLNLIALMKEPLFLEGVLFSSQSLYLGIERYLKSPPQPGERGNKAQRQLERSVMEHLARACMKTVPRGLLTGVGTVTPGEPAPSALAKEKSALVAQRRTVVSLPVIREIAKKISEREENWQHVVPRTNPTWQFEELDSENTRITFWSYPKRDFLDPASKHAFPDHPVVRTFLALAEGRELTAKDLIQAVHQALAAGETPYALSDVERYYRRLCESTLLIGYFEIPFEEADGLQCFTAWLEKLPKDVRPEEELKTYRRASEILKACDLEPSFPKRMEFYSELTRIFGKPPADLLVLDCAVLPSQALSAESLHALENHLRKVDWEVATVNPGPKRQSELPLLQYLSADKLEIAEFAHPEKVIALSPGEPFYMCVEFQMSTDGPVRVRVVPPKTTEFLNRFETLLANGSVSKLIEELREVRKKQHPDALFADVIFSSDEKFANALGFRKIEEHAIELRGCPTSRVSSQRIPLREITVHSGFCKGRGLGMKWRGQELRLSTFQPLTLQGRLENFQDRPPNMRDSSRVALKACEADLAGVKKESLWLNFVELQRIKKLFELSRHCTVEMDYRGHWVEAGITDFYNPVLLENLFAIHENVLRETEQPKVKVRFRPALKGPQFILPFRGQVN
jgi:hypothetical protein